MIENMISVIIPVYNVEKYLDECIESIVNQSYKNIEIILVDDGSTDNSGLICDKYSQVDKRIKVIHQNNAGAAIAKNTGINYAQGECICFVDSDDYISHNFIASLKQMKEDYAADIVECQLRNVYKNRVEDEEFYCSEVQFTSEQYMQEYIKDWKCSLFCTKLFDSRLLKDLRFKTERRCIDDEFFTYKAILEASKVVRIKEPLYFYRQRGSSAVRNKKHDKQKTNDALDILIERYQLVTSKYPQLKKEYINHDIANVNYIFCELFIDNEIKMRINKIAVYYLKEALKNHCSVISIYCILRILFIKKPTRSLDNTKNSCNDLFE